MKPARVATKLASSIHGPTGHMALNSIAWASISQGVGIILRIVSDNTAITAVDQITSTFCEPE